MADQHTYDHNDIRRYLQQQMNREEMHAFEKAMMEDPFLADALEGFEISDHNTASTHLLQIEQEVLGVKEKAKVVPLASTSKGWLRIAALIIMIAGAGIITYNVLDRPATVHEIAANKSVADKIIDSISPKERPVVTPEIFPDKQIAANSSKAGSPVIKGEEFRLNKRIAPQQQADEQAEALALEDKRMEESSEKKLVATAPVAQNAAVMMARTQQPTEKEFKGKVVDTKGEPVPFGSVTIDKYKGTAVDAGGNFSIKSQDSVINVDVSVSGYSTVTAKLRSGEANNTIVLNEKDNSLNEVVITGRPKTLSGRTAGVGVERSSGLPEPEGGWQRFNHYIDSSLNKSKSELAQFSSDVVLEFNIDKEGNPVEIKTANHPNKEMEAKAIELIKKGPKWKPAQKNRKARVVIKF